MKPNDSGVAKWSVLRSTTRRASGSDSASWSAGPGEVAVADDDEHRALDDLQLLGREHALVGPPHHGGERERGRCRAASAYWPNRRPSLSSGSPVPSTPARIRLAALVVALEQVAPDARQHDALEQLGPAGGQAQRRDRAEREADDVDRPVGQGVGDARRHVGVLGRVVRLGGLAVAEQVDADDLAAGVGEQLGEPALAPRRLERPAPPVDEDDRRSVVRHARTVRRGSAARPIRAIRVPRRIRVSLRDGPHEHSDDAPNTRMGSGP